MARVGDLLNRVEANELPLGSVIQRDDGDGKEYATLTNRSFHLWTTEVSDRWGAVVEKGLGSGQWRVLKVG